MSTGLYQLYLKSTKRNDNSAAKYIFLFDAETRLHTRATFVSEEALAEHGACCAHVGDICLVFRCRNGMLHNSGNYASICVGRSCMTYIFRSKDIDSVISIICNDANFISDTMTAPVMCDAQTPGAMVPVFDLCKVTHVMSECGSNMMIVYAVPCGDDKYDITIERVDK